MFNYWDVADLFANVLAVIFFLFLSFRFTIKILTRRKANMMTVLFLLMHTFILISTYFHHGNIKHWGMALVSSGTLALFFEQYGMHLSKILKVWFPVVELFLIINTITILTGGIENEDWLTDYFLGSKNTFEVVFASFFLIIYLHKIMFKGPTHHYYICYFLMIFAIFVTKSTTMLMEFTIFIVLLLFRNYRIARTFLEYRILLVVFLLGNLFLIIYAYNSDLDKLIDFLRYETEKGDSSFTERIRMWISGFELILANPIMGVGRMSEEFWITFVKAGDYKTQLHNQIIEYMVTGGVVLLVILLAVYVRSAYMLYKYREVMVSIIMSLICFSLNIANMMEAYYNALYFFPFLMTGYLPIIIESLSRHRLSFNIVSRYNYEES